MLLPLPASVMRDLSLENHLALVTLRSGQGTSETVASLLRVLYMTYFVLGAACSEADLVLFLEAETVLDSSISVAAQGRGWQMSVEQLPPLERLVLRFDEALGSVPKYCYIQSWERLRGFVLSPAPLPLPGSRLMAPRP